jgi:hypothetical protein
MVVFGRVQTFMETAISVILGLAALPLLVYWIYWTLRLMFKKGDRL